MQQQQQKYIFKKGYNILGEPYAKTGHHRAYYESRIFW